MALQFKPNNESNNQQQQEFNMLEKREEITNQLQKSEEIDKLTSTINVNDMILEIRGITDSSEKYWFSIIDNKWFFVRYRNYDFGS